MIFFFDIYQNFIHVVYLDNFFINDNFYLNNFFDFKLDYSCCSSKFKFNISLVIKKINFYKNSNFFNVNVIVYK